MLSGFLCNFLVVINLAVTICLRIGVRVYDVEEKGPGHARVLSLQSQVSSMNCTLVFEACSVVFLWCRYSHTVSLHYFVLRIHCQTSM